MPRSADTGSRLGGTDRPPEDPTADPADPGPDRSFPRPRIVLSRCLEMDACRYNGRMIRSAVVRSLDPWVEWVPVCPEVEMGLGTPRDPIRLVRREGASPGGPRADADTGAAAEGTRLIQPSTGRDLTGRMHAFRKAFLDGLGPVDGFLLKSRSPSCGIDGVKVFAAPDADEPVDREPGMFAAAVLEHFPHLPVEHEARLTEPDVRDRFLRAVFASAARRQGGRRARRDSGKVLEEVGRAAEHPVPDPGDAGRDGGSVLDPPYPPELRVD